jgi:hypothetical protein
MRCVLEHRTVNNTYAVMNISPNVSFLLDVIVQTDRLNLHTFHPCSVFKSNVQYHQQLLFTFLRVNLKRVSPHIVTSSVRNI